MTTHALKPLLIFPCNGNALEALDALAGTYRVLAFIDDDTSKQGREAWGHRILGREAFAQFPNAEVLAVPGNPDSFRTRRRLIESLGIDARRYARAIAPTAKISAHATLGRNVLIMAGVVVAGNAVIGDHVCILPNTVVHHDASVGAWTLVGSNVVVAGNTHVGERCYVGSGSTLMNGLSIAEGSLIGLGSTVIRDVAAGSTVAGNPARVISTGGDRS